MKITSNASLHVFVLWLAAATGLAHAQTQPLPACPAAGSPCNSGGGASQPAVNGATGAGNPIDLTSGNKYFLATDIDWGGEFGLSFERHYNSNTGKNRAFGLGWSHGFETSLTYELRAGAKAPTLRVQQGDGRTIEFRAQGEAVDGRRVYVSHPAGYGVIEERLADIQKLRARKGQGAGTVGEDPAFLRPWVWRWLDGRNVHFDGRGLVRQMRAPARGSLELDYDGAARLVRMRDSHGRTISLAYWDDAAARLGTYGDRPADVGPAQGRLRSVTTPDGATISYLYDSEGMLGRVEYPDRTATRYEYERIAGIPRLTRTIDRDGGVIGEYQYDAYGRANVTQGADGANRIELVYRMAGKGRALNETWLRNGRGDVSVYRWRQTPGNPEPQLVEALGPGCATCAPTDLRYGYDAQGRVNRVDRLSRVDPLGVVKPRVIDSTFTVHDSFGRVVEISRSENGASELLEKRGYAAGGFTAAPVRLERPSVAPRQMQVVEITRDAQGLPLAITERGFTPKYADGKVRYEPIERSTRLGFDSASRLSWVDGPVAGDADRVSFQYTENGWLASVQYPEKIGERFTYDEFGRIHGRWADDGVDWAYRYLPATKRYLTTPQPFVVARHTLASRFEFTPVGRIASYKTGDGRRFTLEYDAARRLAGITNDAGLKVAYTYDVEGNRVVERWRAGSGVGSVERVLRSEFDAYRELVKYSPHSSETTQFQYDDSGSLSGIDDHDAGHIRVIADSEGRVLNLLRATADGETGIASFSMASPVDIDPAELPRFFGDVAEPEDTAPTHAGLRLAALARATIAGDTSVHWSPAAARYQSLVGPKGEVTGFLFDDFGRLVRSLSDDAGLEEFEYGVQPYPSRHCRANGVCESATYDALDRPTSVAATTSSGSTSTARFEYRGLHLAKVSNEIQTTAYRYDGAGRLIERVDRLPVGEYRSTWQFDSQGRLAAQGFPGEMRLELEYHDKATVPHAVRLIDRDGRERTLLEGVQHNLIESFHDIRYGNGLRKRKTHDSQGRLLTVDLHGATPARGGLFAGLVPNAHGAAVSEPLWSSQQLRYDDHGRLAGVDASGTFAPVVTDADDRLLSLGEGPGAQQFRYDAGGNLTQRYSPGESTAFGYEHTSNRLDTADGGKVLHDAAGNVTQFAGLTLEYGPQHRPIHVRTRAGVDVHYAYNALGERVRRTVGGADSWLLYDDERVVGEVDSEGAVTGLFVYLGDEPIAMVRQEARGGWSDYTPSWVRRVVSAAPVLNFIHTDALGTPRYATDEDQRLVWRASYDAFGAANIEAEAGVTINLRFPGQYFDSATGLHDNYRRDYAPQAGRYLQPDPIGLAGGMNLFEYAGANPLVAADPKGTSIVSWLVKRTGMTVVQREIRRYMRDFAQSRIGSIVRRWSQRGMNLADQFEEYAEIMRILDGASGIGVWDVVGLIPVLGDAIDVGRTATQLCRIRALMKRLDRKMLGFNRLPVTGGRWANGVPGNGSFLPDVGTAAHAATGGRAVRYIDGFPDFSPFVFRDARGRVGQVTLRLSGDSAQDIANARRMMRERYPDWVEPPNHTWHHDTQCGRMILVATAINQLAHVGGDKLHADGLCD